MSGEFDFRGEHTAHAGMLRFIVRILGEYGAGVNYENAKDDAITYASLLLEHFWDNRQMVELAEEINFRKREIARWTNVLDQANRGDLLPLKEEIAEDAVIIANDFRPTGNFASALSNLANSISL